MKVRKDSMNTKTTPAKPGQLNAGMLALASAIIQYIDQSDMQVKNNRS